MTAIRQFSVRAMVVVERLTRMPPPPLTTPSTRFGDGPSLAITGAALSFSFSFIPVPD